ncbi:MAG: hydroxylamine reductase [Bacteroidales bacterium]
MDNMFCFQCQEASKGIGCTIKGVCGKDDILANRMDLLVFVCKGISQIQTQLIKNNLRNRKADIFVIDALFSTITNANFDISSINKRIIKGLLLKDKLIQTAKNNSIVLPVSDSISWSAPENKFEAASKFVGVLSEKNEDIRSLKELTIYGIKGLAAYVEHAYNLGFEDSDIYEFIHHGLAQTARKDTTTEELIALVLKTGEYGVKGMALLDKANTSSYGNPEITKVNIGVGTRPGILISGHDLKDIEELLEQTKDSGIDIYTHSEMLPAHYYPAFKKYTHFVGNYGNSWWKQREEFESFNGPILFTTNCIVPPLDGASYVDKLYTTGASGYAGCKHIPSRENGKMKDFSAIIEHAKQCMPPTEIETGEIVGGFAHNQVLALADKVVENVKNGSIKNFVVMAGCDGRMKSRDYYTEFANELPKDQVILTAGCAKYRYNKLPLGDINGIPRMLDAGQCNDSYSLALIALKLKEVFELEDINELPITYNIAWYEQKAVIVLLALLSLGVKNIHLGPTLPAFLSPNVAKILIDNFGIGGITTPEEDMKNWNIK